MTTSDLNTRDSLTVGSAAVSCFCSIIMVATFVVCPTWRSKLPSAMWILFTVLVCDLLAGANYFLAGEDHPTLCGTQGTLMSLFEVGSWIWSMCLALESVVIVRHALDRELTDRYLIPRNVAFHVGVWAYCLTTAFVGLAENWYGKAGRWCWYENPEHILYLGYVPLWFCTTVTVFCDLNLIQRTLEFRINRQSGAAKDSLSQEIDRFVRSRYVRTSLIILIHVAGSARRLMSVTGEDGHRSYETLAFMQGISDPSHGTINLIVYLGFDPALRRELLRFLQGKRKMFEKESPLILTESPLHSDGDGPDRPTSEPGATGPSHSTFYRDSSMNPSTSTRGGGVASAESYGNGNTTDGLTSGDDTDTTSGSAQRMLSRESTASSVYDDVERESHMSLTRFSHLLFRSFRGSVGGVGGGATSSGDNSLEIDAHARAREQQQQHHEQQQQQQQQQQQRLGTASLIGAEQQDHRGQRSDSMTLHESSYDVELEMGTSVNNQDAGRERTDSDQMQHNYPRFHDSFDMVMRDTEFQHKPGNAMFSDS